MSKRLTEKQEAFCQAMFVHGSDTFGNGTKSAAKAGYKSKGSALRAVAAENLTKQSIIERKRTLQAQVAEKMEYTRVTALRMLQDNYAMLEHKASAGDTQAIQARTAIVREFNAISGLHSSTVNTNEQAPARFTPDEVAELKRAASAATSIKLAQ